MSLPEDTAAGDPEHARQPHDAGRPPPSRERWWNASNAISLARLPLAVLFVLTGSMEERLAVLLAAGISDWADGRVARARGTVTRAGELLDPIADRAFMVVALGTLAVEGRLDLVLLPLLLLRDIGVAVGAAVILLRHPGTRLPARSSGKRVTWLQFAATGVILLHPPAALYAALATAAFGAIALQDYVRAVLRRPHAPGA